VSANQTERPDRPVGPGFVVAYTLAQIGAFISFVPLVQVLTPLKAAEIDPAHKTVLLSAVVFIGALVASVANLVAGAVADRTRSRFGRRRPWMVIGAIGVLGAYGLFQAAHTVAGLIAAVVAFQIFFNLLFSAIVALLADRVPDSQKGRVAAFAGLGYPLGTMAGMAIVGRLFVTEDARLLALSAVVIVSVAPLVWGFKETPLPRGLQIAPLRAWRSLLGALWVDPRRHPDFALAWAGRALLSVGVSLAQGYMLFYLQDALHYARLFAGRPAEEGLSVLTTLWAAASVVGALAGGWLSDRLRRRKPFVAAGALVQALAMVGFALSPDWRAVVGAYILYGLGAGCFFAVDMALVAQVLPRVRDAGKDLGVINLSNTLPQAIAPLLAAPLLGGLHSDFHALFLLAAAVSATSALLVLPIRSVR
jgi:MFS family permease